MTAIAKKRKIVKFNESVRKFSDKYITPNNPGENRKRLLFPRNDIWGKPGSEIAGDLMCQIILTYRHKVSSEVWPDDVYYQKAFKEEQNKLDKMIVDFPEAKTKEFWDFIDKESKRLLRVQGKNHPKSREFDSEAKQINQLAKEKLNSFEK